MTYSKRFKFAITIVLLVVAFATSAMAVTITAKSNVNVRQKASTSSTKLTVMTKGTSRTVLGISGNWYKIKMNGKTGYVNKNHVTTESTSTTTQTKITATANVNVRKTASTSGTKLTVMKKGTVATALGTSGNWYKVTVNGKTGYVNKNYVTTGSVGGSAGGSTDTTTQIQITATANVNVRKTASTSGTKLTVMAKGTVATALGTSGNWYKVTVNGKTGYVNKNYVTTGSTGGSVGGSTGTTTQTQITATANVNVRKTASTSGTKLTVMAKGTVATVLGTSGNWYKVTVNGKTGYVNKNYVTTTAATATTNFYANVCAKANSLLGKPYVYGATGPNSFDCSGYTQYIYKYCGKTIPRTSALQYASCKRVSKANLKAGYLVFFSSTAGGSSVGHVAIYIGNNQIAHAANSSVGVIISDLNSAYYSSHYVGAGYY